MSRTTPLVTVPQIKEHIETDVPVAALQRLLEDANRAIVSLFGPHGSEESLTNIDVQGGESLLFLSPPAATVESVVELQDWPSALTETALASTDWLLWDGGIVLERITTGDNAAYSWAPRVQVTYYAATADDARRVRVTIDLVRLALQHNALRSERAGDYSSQAVDYQREREAILRELAPAGGMRIA